METNAKLWKATLAGASDEEKAGVRAQVKEVKADAKDLKKAAKKEVEAEAKDLKKASKKEVKADAEDVKAATRQGSDDKKQGKVTKNGSK